MKKFIAFLGLFFITLVVFSITIYYDQPVIFADEKLEFAVRETLNHFDKPIYQSQLLPVIEIDLSNREIKDLRGIEHFRNLEILNLGENQFQDLTPLKDLHNLRSLDLSHNLIDDLEKANFQYLLSLSLVELKLNHIFSPLEADVNVRTNNLALIGKMSNLEVLSLNQNHIGSIEPLSTLSKLTSLSLIENNIEQLSGLETLSDLIDLRLRDNLVSDISQLEALNQLEYLDLRNNQINSVNALNNKTEITHLDLRDNQVLDITHLGSLTRIKYLNLHSNPVEKGIEVIENFQSLDTLILRNVKIGENHNIFQNLTYLTRLNIRNTDISDVSVIGDLMEKGAIQNCASSDVEAVIDMLDISPSVESGDPYQNLRRYWDNINIRYPISLPFHPSEINPPVFSHESGYYDKGFHLSLNPVGDDLKVFFTTDGSEPTLDPHLAPIGTTVEYDLPILIKSRSGDENIYSADVFGRLPYIPSDEQVFKINIIRALAVDDFGNRSNVISQTYFIDNDIQARYSFPIISIMTSPDNLFDQEIGIYVPGKLFENIHPDQPWLNPSNFVQRGKKWERPIAWQLFSPDGILLSSQNLGLRIHGQATRYYNQKSLRFYASEEYDSMDYFSYSFFPGLDYRLNDDTISTFETLILRNGGNDWWRAMIRDPLAHSLLEHTKIDIQGNYPTIVFINGEYWGIHNLRNRYDEHYFESYYGLDPEEVIMLEGWMRDVKIGESGDEYSYFEIYETIDENYLANQFRTVNSLRENPKYQMVVNKIDVENFIDYYVSQIFLGNGDWPKHNIRFWKKRGPVVNDPLELKHGHDGKWRWIFHDIDASFRNYQIDNLKSVLQDQTIDHYLFRSLIENDEFRHQFINTFADHLNTTFHEETVLKKIDEMQRIYEPEIEEQTERWGNLGGSLDRWKENIDEIREFAVNRPTRMRDHINQSFGLKDTSIIVLKTNFSQGIMQINSIEINEDSVGGPNPSSWSGEYFNEIPLSIKAFPKPGYRFSHWENNTVKISDEAILIISLESDLNLLAVFEQKLD